MEGVNKPSKHGWQILKLSEFANALDWHIVSSFEFDSRDQGTVGSTCAEPCQASVR